MATARVVAVAPGSPAALAGVVPGDELLCVNGEEPRDIIRYQILTDEPLVELDLRHGGIERTVAVSKASAAPLGLELHSAVFDRVRTCDNHCPFCFIHQLPAGMRRSLSVKDDDYRLSFLYGNFTTLTRFTEADLERVVTERLGPLYVSIHATDPALRARLLRNRRGATSLRFLSALLEAGIEVHGQVVVCPGLNDGVALDETLLGILDRFSGLASVGVVPVGISDHNHEADLRVHTEAEAAMVLDQVQVWQERFRAALGRRVVFAADEYHLLAGRPFPSTADYEDFPQHENGIGMAASFWAEARDALDVTGAAGAAGALAGTRRAAGTRGGFFASVDGAPATGYRAPRVSSAESGSAPGTSGVPVGILTGDYGVAVLAPLLEDLNRVAGVAVRLVPVANRFFGGNIAVTGLLTGADVARVLADEPAGHRYLLPDVVLSNGRFLDDATPSDLPRSVEVVPTDGASLVTALLSGSTPLRSPGQPASAPLRLLS